MLKKSFIYAVFVTVVSATGMLSGCGGEDQAAKQGQSADQAAIDQHNAQLARKNEVRRAIK